MNPKYVLPLALILAGVCIIVAIGLDYSTPNMSENAVMTIQQSNSRLSWNGSLICSFNKNDEVIVVSKDGAYLRKNPGILSGWMAHITAVKPDISGIHCNDWVPTSMLQPAKVKK
jgi:hypothetical protein